MSTQLALAFSTGRPTRRPRVSFFATVPMTPADLARAVAIAEHQDVQVFAVFQYAQKPLSPSQVQRRLEELGVKILLTSVRRSISTLTKEGLLAKLDDTVPGLWRRNERLWRLA